jgi:membrane fusion protein (multidrug efflux system)
MMIKAQPRFSLIILLASLMLIASCSDDSATDDKNKRRGGNKGGNNPIPVELASPEVGKASSYYVTTATLSANSDAKINARTSGVILELLHEEGDDVAEGEVLLLLENDDQKLRLKQARVKLASAEREYRRLNEMKKAGAVSTNEWEASNTAYLAAQTDLELAELALSYTKVSAPFTGRLVWREVDRGAFVSNGELLFRMMSIHPLLLRVHVPANRIEKVAVGQMATIKVDSIDSELQAIISLVSPIVDPTSGTVKVTLRLDDYPEAVRPGDFTEVHMVTNSRENALLLPTEAIIEERGEHYLYLSVDNKAQRRNVEVGFVLDDKTEILSGLTTDDKVVVKGQRNLNEGNLLKDIDQQQSDVTVVQGKKDKKGRRQRKGT